MELKTHVKFCIFLVLLVLFAGATFEEIINDKRKQSEIIEKEIIENKSLITGNSTQNAKLRKEIDSIESSINALNNFLKNYESETYMTPDQIAVETNMIIFLAEEVDRIQESFRQKVLNLYKRGKNYELELLMSSKTPNEYLRRNQYLQKFAQNRKKELRDLQSKKFILEEKKKMLTLSTSSQRYYVESRRHEKSALENNLGVLKKEKDIAENGEGIIAAKIKRYETQLDNIRNFINNFENNRESFTERKNTRISYESGDLTAVKGNINLPIDVGLITSNYGSSINNSTNTLAFNNGIDFSVAKDSKVHAVANGVVTLVGELPYYGKVIIVKHESGFRSVYASLSEINAAVGDNIRLNQVIGKTGETIDGQSFHFELWQNATPLNPKEWLRF